MTTTWDEIVDDLRGPTHLVDPSRPMAGDFGVPVYCQEYARSSQLGADHTSARIDDVTCDACIEALRTGGVRR